MVMKMKQTRLHIIRFFALLLLFCGTANEAWAQVTYHILTKPFSVKMQGGESNKWTDIRVEALRCTSTATTVGLPAQYISPLATGFRYFKGVTCSHTNTVLYDNTGSGKLRPLSITYDIYENTDIFQAGGTTPKDGVTEMTAGNTLESYGNPTEIWVTYDYDDTQNILDLTGTKHYNIKLNNRFLTYNRSRNNRPAAIKADVVPNEALASNQFVYFDGADTDGFKWDNYGPHELYFQFKFTGSDPYNITFMTAYAGDETYLEDLAIENKVKYLKPIAGATIFTRLANNSTGKGSEDKIWLAVDHNRHYKNASEVQYDEWEGFYRGDLSPLMNAFTVLPNSKGGHMFVVTKLNQNNTTYQPNGDGYYAFLTDDSYNPVLRFKAFSNAPVGTFYEVKNYTFKVTTQFGTVLSATSKWSDVKADEEIQQTHVPASLKRKFCGIVGFYKDAALTQKITKYSDVPASGDIYVKYETTSDIPFTAIGPSDSYTTATWYEMTDKDSSGKKIRWDSENSVYKNNGGASTYEKESEFAFVGDPYELRIVSRKLTQYVGSSSRTTEDDLTNNASDAGAGFKWEIPYDDVNDDKKSFQLKEFNGADAYWYWNTTEGSNIQYSTTHTNRRIRVMEIAKQNYTFKVVDLSGRVAIQATESLTPFTTLTGYDNIPASIRSPFLADETVTFYGSYEDSDGNSELDRRDWHSPSEQATLTELPATSSDIYVSYTTSRLASKNIKLIYSEQFNVKLNDEYIYWDSSTGKIRSKASPNSSELKSNAYLWHLRGRDPYSMCIDNKGASDGHTESITIKVYDTSGNGTYTTESVSNGMFVRVGDDGTWGNDKELTFVADRDQASRFVAMMSNNTGVYEVLGATGNSDQYHIGRISTAGVETKIYSTDTENGGYAHGADELRFELFGETEITYTLIDRAGNELIEVKSKNPRLALPSNYVSPLVTEYYYYKTKEDANAYRTAGTVGTRIKEISEAPEGHVWVVYDPVANVFGTSNPYMLKFHNGASYHMEDGVDNLTTSVANPKAKIKAVYPYCNGDGNLNIYGQEMNDEQMAGGANTRPRWVWYLESDNSDPYHVKIHSKSTISFNGATNTTYIQTYAVHFDQDTEAPNKQRIVTGANFPGISGTAATEYMILGSTGRYKLLTTYAVAADLDGDGNKSGTGENERRNVTSFEQYWKTYNMVRQYVLGEAKAEKDSEEAFNGPIIMPSDRWPTLKTKLTALGVDDEANRVDDCSWHSYEAIANATRWNGYTDVLSGYEKKKVERLQHWFQTFDMGDGTFDIETADIPSVLVLLDRHGWEIMRKPIPTGNSDAEATTKLAALRAYDSPMVKEYTFYSNATKASGCHKYTLRMQNGAERDTISVNGKRYKSYSLATLPPYKADQDLFVTYTVKEEYDKSYTYTLDYDEIEEGGKITGYTINTEKGTPSAFIVLQDHQYAGDTNTGSITATTAPSPLSSAIISGTFDDVNLWYVQPNLSIDDEMGIPWSGTVGNSNEPYEIKESKVKYKDKTGFDPYNLQLVNKSTGKFFTTHMTDSELSGGAYNGVYSGDGGSLDVTLADKSVGFVASSESYDHTHLKITNQTFMAVQDVNGNMQIMPRFDHNTRINAFATLTTPDETQTTKHNVDEASPGSQTTFMVRPVVYDYRIIDNEGNVAMRFKTAGESYPSMPEHFKSPLAEDFRYYKTLEDSNSDGAYDLATLDDEITSSFAAAGISGDANIFIRYTYNDNYDTDHDNILQGQWLTMKLNSLDVQAIGTLDASDGTGISLYGTTKPADAATLQASTQWHWKFLQSPNAPTLPNGDPNPLYVAPDPYAVRISNRAANYDNDFSPEHTNKMGTAIKVGTADRFVILAHGDDYALLKADDDADHFYFLNGDGMTVPTPGEGEPKAASMVEEDGFSSTSSTIINAAKIQFADDILHTFTYHVITNAKAKAATASPTEDEISMNRYTPYLPASIQSPLISEYDYIYYGSATNSSEVYTVVDGTQINTLYGLYDDVVYVRYPEFDRDKTPYLVPNKKGTSGGHVAKHAESNDVAIDISGDMPYNIIWYDDNMMAVNGDNISDGGPHDLTGNSEYTWYLEGRDPYALKIKKADNKYIDALAALSNTPQNFMLLRKDGYDYGVFAKTGNQTYMLSFGAHDDNPYTMSLDEADPNNFIIFALSTHQLIYHLVINTSGSTTSIPYRDGNENSWRDENWREWQETDVDDIPGTTQRDLDSQKDDNPANARGSKYQLGSTIFGQTYCVDAGQVSLGDELDVPSELERANCVYFYSIDNIQTKAAIPGTYQKTVADVSAMNTDAASLGAGAYYYYKVGSGSAYYRAHKESSDAIIVECTADDYSNAWQDNTTLNNRYKGLKVTKLMSDSELIGSLVKVNVTYGFNTGLETNVGEGFVTEMKVPGKHSLWYTFETKDGPYLAHYTNAWGLQAMEGRDTRYTNDYLWSPLGDVYGFRMYNRYVYKTSNETTRIMTTEDFTEGRTLKMAVPGSTITNEDGTPDVPVPEGNEVYELLANETTTPGYFLIHPVINNTGDQYYIRRNTESGAKKDFAILSTTPTEWTFGLTEDLVKPYHDRAGYVGGLTTAGKTAYEAASTLQAKQAVVYDDDKIVKYAPGYYRLHNQPGVSGISPVRYASGYLHDIEKTAVAGGIPMHFYSRKGVNTTFEGEGGLGSGFTETVATRGDIPIPATEYDPSTIFYFNGAAVDAPTLPTSSISTQGLYVKGVQTDDNHGKAIMTTAVATNTTDEAGTFTIMDIGGAVFLIHNGSGAQTRKYLHFDQSNSIYDLKYFHNSPTDDAKWCLEPANNQGLMVATNDGGDGYFYSTFCAPFDVLMPTDEGTNIYYAYVCDAWDTEIIHPNKVPEKIISEKTYPAGEFVPAGTPVIIRTTDNTGKIKLTLPTDAPTTPAVTCIFTGKYLEQLLATEVTAEDKVYAFGLPITGYTGVTTTSGATNGEIENPVGRDQADKGVGFYINATQNKEKGEESGLWTPNNRYVIHNKIYYRASSSGAGTRGVKFVPVIFGDEEEEKLPGIQDENDYRGDGCVYDLMGRKVATRQQVIDGTWRNHLTSGIYIINGKKIIVK